MGIDVYLRWRGWRTEEEAGFDTKRGYKRHAQRLEPVGRVKSLQNRGLGSAVASRDRVNFTTGNNFSRKFCWRKLAWRTAVHCRRFATSRKFSARRRWFRRCVLAAGGGGQRLQPWQGR